MTDILNVPPQAETSDEIAWRESYQSVCRKLDRERQAHQMTADASEARSRTLGAVLAVVPGLRDWMRETFDTMRQECERGQFAYAAGYTVGASENGLFMVEELCEILGLDPLNGPFEANTDD